MLNYHSKPKLLFLAGLLVSTTLAQAQSFVNAPGSPITAGLGGLVPVRIVTGDFNNDGIPDLVTVNEGGAGTISVFLGTGNGGFTAGASNPITVGAGAYSIAAGDFNLDGKMDLAVTTLSGHVNTLIILLGNGAGGFSTAQALTPCPGNTDVPDVVVADFNGDHKPDLAVSCLQTSQMSVFLGSGNGTFSAGPGGGLFATGASPLGMAAADVNGDGKIDLISANIAAGTLTVRLGDGTGNFPTSSTISTGGTGALHVAAGDVNGDGKVDLVVTNQGSNTVAVLLRNGNGSFTTASGSPFAVGVLPNTPILRDMDNDGKLDLVVSNETGMTVSVFHGNGDGTFTALSDSPYTVSSHPEGIAIADFNLDGKLDIASANNNADSVSVLLGNLPKVTFKPASGKLYTTAGQTTIQSTSFSGSCDGNCGNALTSVTQPWMSFSFGGARGSQLNANPTGLAAGVYTGILRGFGTNFDIEAEFDLTLNVANPASGFISALGSPFSAGTNPRGIVSGDFNKDGKLDMAVLNQGSANVSILLGNGSGGFTAGGSFSVGSMPSGLTVGDFDGDGNLDLAVANTGSNDVTVLFGNGTGSFVKAGPTYGAATGAAQIIAGDFNHDGIPDLAVAGSSNMSLLLGNGFGAFYTVSNTSIGPGAWNIVSADFNLDDNLDVAISANSSSAIFVLLGNGKGGFSAAAGSPISIPGQPFALVTGDLNGDGAPDLATASVGNNTVTVLLGSGTGTFTPTAGSPIATGGVFPNSMGLADFDGDGKPDLLVVNGNSSSSANTRLFLGDGAGNFTAQSTLFGGGNAGYSFMVVGDFNNDGRQDAAIADFFGNDFTVLLGGAPPTPTLSIMKSHTGNFQSMQQGAQYTISVGNTGNGAIAAGSAVKVIDNIPSGMNPVSASGTGWSCALNSFTFTCSRSDGLAAGATFPSITVTVNVTVAGPTTITNSATAMGGGASNAPSSSDTTTISAEPPPVWGITKSHTGNFTQGQQSAAYVITVTNNGTGNAHTATLTENLPAGLTLVSMDGGQSWSCSGNTCTFNPQALNLVIGPGGSSQVTVKVNVASNAAASVTNSATVSGGGAAASATAMDPTTITPVSTGSPQWSITKQHFANFSQGQHGASYLITVTNTGNARVTVGTITDNLPAGLTIFGMGDNNIHDPAWSCSGNQCSLLAMRSLFGTPEPGGLAPGEISIINVFVDVAPNAPGSVTNMATVSSPGINSATAMDVTTIMPVSAGTPQWSILESHSGAFTQGQTGATSTITVSNTGTGATSGQVTVTATPPSGFTTTGMSGTGWTCSCLNTCTRNDGLAAGQSYPGITITFNIAGNTAANVTDMATVVGGGVSMAAVANDPITVNQSVAPPPGPPIGSFDTPGATSTASGSLSFTGWALEGTGITKVDLWREPNPGEAGGPNGLAYIGDANLVPGARPDVQAAFPAYPGNNSAGWGYLMLTNFLPSNSGNAGLGNGTYKIHAIAHGADGLSTDLGTKTIIVDNLHSITPFGAIDTPSQGGSASGMYANFGWALTPVGKSIPTDGSTITVLVDNAPLTGHPTYNLFRSDVATLFPGYANSGGAIGVYTIDTTKMTNGRHTIAWLATDTAGQTGAIGSRYFTVQNACTGM